MNNKRLVDIIQYINKDNYTIKKLSLLCDVPYKTIQDDIKFMNGIFSQRGVDVRILSKTGIGVFFDGNNIDIEQLINIINANFDTNYDRKYYYNCIISDLFSNDYLKINEIVEKYNLSRSVVNKYINEIKKHLRKWDISLESRSHYGLYVSASENNIRHFIFDRLIAEDDDSIYKFLNISPKEYFSLRENVIALAKNYDISISGSSLEQLLLYVEITAVRISRNHTIRECSNNFNHSSFEWMLSNKIYGHIKIFLNKEINENEINWICCFVDGKCIRSNEKITTIQNKIIEKIVKKSFDLINKKYHLDFSNDLDLYSSISIHIKALLERIEINNFAINPMAMEIKSYSILAYDIAVDICQIINDELKTNLPEDEISYFAIYLHLAIQRQNNKIQKRKAIVACPTGKGMSELAAHYINQHFGEYLSELKVCGYYDLNDIDFSEYDYLFTMKHLNNPVPIPTVEFSINSNIKDIEITKNELFGVGDYPLYKLTSENLFFSNIDASDKYDALNKIIKKVSKVVKLNKDFYDSVIDREKIVSTELENYFAIPHPLNTNMAEVSFFSIAVLQNPIIWNENKVSIILLAYIETKDDTTKKFYEIMTKLVSDKEYSIRLIEDSRYENFVSIVKEINNSL